MLLALAMVWSLAACGGTSDASTTDSSGAAVSSAESTTDTAQEESEPEDAETPSEPSSAEEASAEEPETDTAAEFPEVANPVTYPIPGDYTLTMTNIIRNNTAAALGDGSLSDTYLYEASVEATGVNIEFMMLGEATSAEKLTLIIASGEYPDIFNSSIGNSYDSNPLGAIEDEVIIDFSNLLEEHAPDYAATINSNETFKYAVTNSDGSICRFNNYALANVTQGLIIRQD